MAEYDELIAEGKKRATLHYLLNRTSVDSRPKEDYFEWKVADAITALQERLEELEGGLRKIAEQPPVDSEFEMNRRDQSMRLNEVCRSIARTTLGGTNDKG